MAVALLLVTAFAKADEVVKGGVYWVPVGPRLAQFALFDIPKVAIESGEDTVKIQYDLPPELTGTAHKVEFEGPRSKLGPVVLTGDYGKMECPAANDFSNCSVSYRDLNFDASARTALLQSISKNDEELRKRELVAARFQFGGEPHGFLRVLEQQTADSGY
jgi:hypothetical protein